MNAETDELRAARRRLSRFTWVFVAMIAGGTVGYALTMDIDLWRAFRLTIETLAYLGKEREEGKALAIQLALLHGGTLVTWYEGWLVVDLVLENHFLRHFREMRRMKKVESMSGHVVICGGGGVGAHLAEVLAARKEPFVVVEIDEATTTALRERGFLVATGDARDEETLRTAGVDRAARVFAALPEADKNVMVALTALALNEAVEVHARCERADYAPKLARAGVRHVVIPQRACAEQMIAGAFTKPGGIARLDPTRGEAITKLGA
jgi:voltage-gated potassium channel Kch